MSKLLIETLHLWKLVLVLSLWLAYYMDFGFMRSKFPVP